MLRGKFTYLLLVLVAMIFAACSAIYDDGQCVDEGGRRVIFTISVADQDTRTTWGDDYTSDIGTSFDNLIRLDAFRVAVHSAQDNSYIGEVDGLTYWQEGANRYTFMGNASHLNLTEGSSYKIMVYANSPQGKASDNLNFDYTTAQYDTGAIPMWGVKQIAINADARQDIGVIYMLRAVAKVEVALVERLLTKYSIESVTVDAINRYGYCLPKGWDSAEDTAELIRHSSMEEYRSLYTPDGGVPFTVLDGSRALIYLPDYLNTDPLTPHAKLTVTLRSKATDDLITYRDALEFANYANGKLVADSNYDIVRNHYYKFNITGVTGSLQIEYSVAAWKDGDGLGELDFSYPTYHNPVLPTSLYESGMIDSPITVAPRMKYNAADLEKDAFSVWFAMTSPKGQTWVPTIYHSPADYAVKVYKNGVELTEPEQWVAGNEWYNIKVIPLDPDNVGQRVKFGITYTATWMHAGTSLYLFINGKADNIAWPDSGSDPKMIEILQE